MKRTTTILLLLFVFLGCKKKITKTHPELVGDWSYAHWCYVDDFSYRVLFIHEDNHGRYKLESDFSEEDYSGKVTSDGDDIYIKNKFVFTIVEIKDTTGYIYAPLFPAYTSLCDHDSLLVKNTLLRIKDHNGANLIFYK